MATNPPSLLTADDLHLFNEGTHYRLYEKLGARPMVCDGVAGTYFAVWAPNAKGVAVIGAFSRWLPDAHPLTARGMTGVWEGFVPGLEPGELYKLWIESRAHKGFSVDKADPFAFRAQLPPDTASEVADLRHEWADAAWMADRGARLALSAPISIYEVHLGSWRRSPDDPDRV
ncbi:MAG TPA: 1,4-alpha-glucan branching enzyme, partial [Thermoanaerobaculia bacterium]|nr:1,4-alpha-glucan branching enzyme [Thermoanaerobaculia bacterium]